MIAAATSDLGLVVYAFGLLVWGFSLIALAAAGSTGWEGRIR